MSNSLITFSIINSLSNGYLNTVDFYKSFYKKHLLYKNQKEVKVINDKLSDLTTKHIEYKPNPSSSYSYEQNIIISKTSEFLEKNFGNKTKEVYNKAYSIEKKQNEYTTDSVFWSFVGAFASSISETQEKLEKEWHYKKEFIKLLLDCSDKYGLHENILLRDITKYERLNLVVYHYKNHNFKRKHKAFRMLMTKNEYENYFVPPYKSKNPVLIEGMLIPFDKIERVKIYSTLLLDDEIKLFAKKNDFSWNDNKKDNWAFIQHLEDVTDKYLSNPFIDNIKKSTDRFELIELLSDFPNAKDLYEKGLSKSGIEGQERNCLDDLRLSLEQLLKQMFGNNKSLEKQLPLVGKHLKGKGTVKEVTNMFNTLLNHYSKYQNENVKHNDLSSKEDVELILNLTSTFMEYLIKSN